MDHDLDHAMESISRETFENGITCGSTCENRPPCFPIEIDSDDARQVKHIFYISKDDHKVWKMSLNGWF